MWLSWEREKVKEKEDTRENQCSALKRVQSWTGVEYCDGWETHPTAHVTCSFWPSNASLQEGGRQGRAGQGRAGQEGGCALRSANWAVSTFDNNSQELESQTCATTFSTSWGEACMYLTVVSSNRSEAAAQATRGGTCSILNDHLPCRKMRLAERVSSNPPPPGSGKQKSGGWASNRARSGLARAGTSPP